MPVSYRLDYSQQERSGVKDPLEVEGFTLYESHKKLDEMPVLANLKHGPVGYVGERSLVLEQLQLLIHQLAVFHSYHDVQFITIMPEEEKEQWQGSLSLSLRRPIITSPNRPIMNCCQKAGRLKRC